MKPKIHPSIIFRTPKFSYQANLSACWDELKEAISISSTAFYDTIKDIKADELNTLPPKVHFTIWKYFNRAKYRSTPYGTFASFSIFEQAIKQNESQIVINEQQIVHQLIDWPYRSELNIDFAEVIANNGLIFSNTSYYLVSSSIRYITCANGVFELSEIEFDTFIKQILDACVKPITVSDLVEKLSLSAEEKDNLLSLLFDMHALQLVFTHLDPNIIGDDYFDRIGVANDQDKPQYLIAERKALSGGLDEKLLRNIPGLIELLAKMLPSDHRDTLKTFINKFIKKFDQKEVSLVTALDPELGVGYGELEQASDDDDFINHYQAKKGTEKEGDNLKSVLKTNVRGEAFLTNETIFLNKLSFPTSEKASVLPNSLSLLMTVADELICVDQIGGATANALTGRFSMADEAVEKYSKATAEIEQNANPNVLFFDVAYMVETTIDNVNRRKSIYNHQLSILNFDTSESPLAINDILISIRNNEVFLRSKSLNKRLIPRLASAYNYTRSDLSLFRLLCDLQNQGIQGNLSLSLDRIFPDLASYPRFQYHNIVLSAAKWQVKNQMFYDGKVPFSVNEARKVLENIGVSQFFKTGSSDQTLCFNLERDEDLNAFIQFMQKQMQVYLEEVLLKSTSSVIDQHQKPYLAQFILNINHNESIYRAITETQNQEANIQEVFLPGKEWLYFEIYCHQQRSDEILSTVISTFINQFKENIKSWFFIRYDENGNHIRFRIQLNEEKEGQKLISAFGDLLQDYMDQGLVSDLQLKSYKREIERYGANLIKQVEHHFSIDSEFVISLLQSQVDAFTKYKWCSKLVNDLNQAGVFKNYDLVKVIRKISDMFNDEHQLDATDFKKLNQQYQSYKTSPPVMPSGDQVNYYLAFKNSFFETLNQCSEDKVVKLFSDLMHMHVNRLFTRDQRTNEMIMYYFLLKDIQRKNAMA